MPSNRLRPAAAFVAVALCAALAGCGVPGASAPVVVADAPKLAARQDTEDARPPDPDGARNGTELVLRYLQAAAWANGTNSEDRPRATEDAIKRVRAFFTDDGKKQWQPQSDLTVVQANVGQPKPVGGGLTQVTMQWRPIGTLSERGYVDSTQTSLPPGSAPYTATFEIEQSGAALRIAGGAPPGMLISAEALRTLYEEHPIYFWDRLDRELVPDLRYLPRSVQPAKRHNTVVGWLLGGPSPWLSSVAQSVPSGIEVNGNVAQADQRPDSPLVVNLSANAAVRQDRLPHFVSQLRWSLRPFAAPVQLQILQQQQSGVDGSSNAYLVHNPAVHPGGITEPDRYCVVAGQIQPSELHTGRAELTVVKNPVNTGVVSAAVNRNQVAALVRPVGNRQQLWLPDRTDPAKERYTPVDQVVGHSITTPVWVSWPKSGVLVAVDGQLLYVPASGEPWVDVTPPGLGGKVTAVAVAPDNRRLGLVAGGQVYVTTLNTGTGTGTGTLTVAQPRALATGLTEPVAVAWSRETRLVVAGRSGPASTLAEVSVDGVTIEFLPLTNLASLPVSRLAGYPRSPINGPDLIGLRGLLMIEARGRAWKVFTGQVEELPPKDRTANAACTAPFFVD